tara:strand:+ start:648 stop:1262 length:615 start_codon:yes stop_codon:yes gene_type:complete
MKNLITLLFLFISVSLLGSEIVSGEIIYSDNTIKVEFKIPTIPISGDINFMKIQKGVKYRKNKNQDFITLLPGEAKEYNFKLLNQEIEMVSLLKDRPKKGKTSTSKERIFLRNIVRGEKMSFYKYYHISIYQTITNLYRVGDERPIFKKSTDEYCSGPSWYSYSSDMKAYFRDCNELIKRFKNNQFPWERAIDAAKFYNLECGK